MKQYDIVIAGAGPTGLMAANQLAKFNINFLILDPKSGPTEQSRAIVITARSMEIYQQMGISQVAIDQGRFITEMAIFIKGKERASAVIGEFGKGKTDFSYMLAFEQSKNEQLLAKNLRSFNRDISWNTELVKINQQENNLELDIKHISTAGSPVEKITTKYLIGCDGAKSIVRHLMNFTFEGGTYEKQFYVADTKLKWEEGENKLVLCPGKKKLLWLLSDGGNKQPSYYRNNTNGVEQP